LGGGERTEGEPANPRHLKNRGGNCVITSSEHLDVDGLKRRQPEESCGHVRPQTDGTQLQVRMKLRDVDTRHLVLQRTRATTTSE